LLRDCKPERRRAEGEADIGQTRKVLPATEEVGRKNNLDIGGVP